MTYIDKMMKYDNEGKVIQKSVVEINSRKIFGADDIFVFEHSRRRFTNSHTPDGVPKDGGNGKLFVIYIEHRGYSLKKNKRKK